MMDIPCGVQMRVHTGSTNSRITTNSFHLRGFAPLE
jgi:hypothetical protein